MCLISGGKKLEVPETPKPAPIASEESLRFEKRAALQVQRETQRSKTTVESLLIKRGKTFGETGLKIPLTS